MAAQSAIEIHVFLATVEYSIGKQVVGRLTADEQQADSATLQWQHLLQASLCPPPTSIEVRVQCEEKSPKREHVVQPALPVRGLLTLRVPCPLEQRWRHRSFPKSGDGPTCLPYLLYIPPPGLCITAHSDS